MRSAAGQDAQFRIREYFLSGIAAIARYDIDSPGCEQAMRLLDYYSALALELQDPEMFNILNTVMTDKIRKNLERIEAEGEEVYLSAVAARHHIKETLSEYHLKRKGLL
jgi:hypothetical protein